MVAGYSFALSVLEFKKSSPRPRDHPAGGVFQSLSASFSVPDTPLISFDESGFTGPNLLRDDQPIFAYAAVDLTVEEATELIAEIREGRPWDGWLKR